MKKLEIENLEILNGGKCSQGEAQALSFGCAVGSALWGTVTLGAGFFVSVACGAMITYGCGQ